jgi:hypothetical protein
VRADGKTFAQLLPGQRRGTQWCDSALLGKAWRRGLAEPTAALPKSSLPPSAPDHSNYAITTWRLPDALSRWCFTCSPPSPGQPPALLRRRELHNERAQPHGPSAFFALGFVGLAAAAATLLGGLFRRWLGLSLLYCHIVLFAVSLTFFWGLADGSWVFIPLAALAAAAGYVAVDSSTPGPRTGVTPRARLTSDRDGSRTTADLPSLGWLVTIDRRVCRHAHHKGGDCK